VKILCTVKRVTAPEAKIKVKPDGSGIVEEGIDFKPNPFDEIAVEEALRLVAKHGGEVVVVSVADPVPTKEIRTTLAMGADRAVAVLAHDDGLDSLLVAKILAKVHEQESPDLWILGKQAIDGDSNQVGQMLAGLTGLPQATFASKEETLDSELEKSGAPAIVVSEDGARATVMREVDGGIETLDVPLPAVVTADLRLNLPRYASLPGIMKAKRKEIRELTLDELGLAGEQPRLRVTAYEPPPTRPSGVLVESVSELVDKLKNEAKVL
jgi:electron transfer flavoprotein beta subunit